jgi:hypothetical protein
VSSALSVVTCFIGLAGLVRRTERLLRRVIQILVYSGAVMVLFLFIIMLLDLKDEQKRAKALAPLAAGIGLAIAFVVQLIGVLSHTPDKIAPPLDAETLAAAAGNFGPRNQNRRRPPTAACPMSISSATPSSPNTTSPSRSSASFSSSPPSASSPFRKTQEKTLELKLDIRTDPLLLISISINSTMATLNDYLLVSGLLFAIGLAAW